jgi:hypothetical protein
MSFAAKSEPTVLTTRLQNATANLAEIEQLVKSGDVDPRVLQEFRNSVDLIRRTAWAVQQWIGLKETSADPYSLMPVLAAQTRAAYDAACERLDDGSGKRGSRPCHARAEGVIRSSQSPSRTIDAAVQEKHLRTGSPRQDYKSEKNK